MDKVRICIVGCGRISTLQSIGYLQHPKAQIYAVCDINEQRAREKASEWGVGHVYTRYEDVLADPNIDAAELLVPHNLHCKMTVQACEAGKHVSVQKPMALSVAEGEQMITASKKAGVKFKVYENFVFYPPYVKAKMMIDAGEIGRPLSIRIKLNSGGGHETGWKVEDSTWAWRMDEESCGGGPLVFDDGYHKFSIARYLMGDVEKVSAWIDHMPDPAGESYGGYADAPATIMWKYKDPFKYGMMDVTYSYEMFIDSKYYACDERVEVTGSSGVLWVTRCTARMLQIPTLMVYKDGCVTSYNGLRDDWADSFIDSSKDFIDAILDDREPVLSGKDGLEVLKFALGAIRSNKEGREIRMDEM